MRSARPVFLFFFPVSVKALSSALSRSSSRSQSLWVRLPPSCLLGGPFNQFRGVFLKHCLNLLFFFPPKTSYCLDGGPSRRLPRFLFLSFPSLRFLFLPLLGRSCSGLSSSPYIHIFHYVSNFQDVFSFPNAPSTENEDDLLPFRGSSLMKMLTTVSEMWALCGLLFCPGCFLPCLFGLCLR